jgi:hypothetical protein
MLNALLIILLLAIPAVQEVPATGEDHEVRLLSRRDLPADLNLPFEEAGFAVLHVTVRNRQEQELTIEPEHIRILDTKGKEVPQAEPSEIVPKLMKVRGFRPKLNAEAGGYRGPTYGRPYGGVGASTGGGVGVVNIGQVELIRTALETHHLKLTSLAPGEQVEGLLYLRTKKKAQELAGTRVQLTAQLEVTIK